MQRPPIPEWPQYVDNREPYIGRTSYPPPSNYPPQSIYPPPSNYPPPAAYPPPSNYPPSSSYYSPSTYRSEPDPPSSAVPYFTHLDVKPNEPHTTNQNEFLSPNYRPPVSPSDPSAGWHLGVAASDDVKQEPLSVLPIQSSPVPRPTTELSPMENPPNYRRVYWVILVLANVYLLVGSILLIRLFYEEVFEMSTLAKVLFIAITVFEALPRLLILIQLRKIVKENISLLLTAGILFGKKEVYLLFGRTKLSQQQIDRLAVMSDLICVLYLIWLGFAYIIDFGGIKSSHETDHRILLLGISLAFSICILVARVVLECIKHCCMGHPKHKHQVQNGFDGSVPDFVHHESDKDKKKKKKEKKSKKKKKEKGREIGA